MKKLSHDECWCGSHKKYKKCHEKFDKRLRYFKKQGYVIPSHAMIKNEKQIEGIKQAALINNGLLDYIESHICAGMSTLQIDDMTVEYLKAHDATSADLHYQGYPKSICTSVNDEVCHGIPSEDVILKSGDIINVDATSCYKGYYADASRMFMIGEVSEEARKLVAVTRECLYKGIEAVRPFKSTISDIGKAIETHAHQHGFSVVREFCGHGVGLSMHEDPYVLHYDPHYPTTLLVPGMVITIEPMINAGKRYVHIGPNGWSAFTDDGSLSAQWEHTILVTETGVEILSM
ncbi:type I methionyl aminopeptidase [Allocoprobacillus halotolerans]|uniref:Methionine aminopeptidase n=1 Tax=Allocoprobacillus halotolerans TaxID=2944914 RepID=A0ABY5I2Y6_9FIRM|nr:type I methionyl aminopeptidase [Allocoprobacillus halotolerans]UTY38340.1 type I methionyl aminopeptidase [Allocoprobacillus halotolerans]